VPIDLTLYLSHTRGRGIVEVFLRGHLWIEKFLIELLEAEVPNPSPLRLDRMNFASKVNLGEALNLLSPTDAASLRVLNSLRNRLAHDLEGEPTLADVKRLEAGLSESQTALALKVAQAEVHNDGELPFDPDEIVRLSAVVLAILTEMEMHRQRHVYWREHRGEIEAFHVAAAMITQAGGEPMTLEEYRRKRAIPDPPGAGDVVLKKPSESQNHET
jgi:hypothetical protein